MSVTVVITGDKKLNKALRKLPSKEQKAKFKAAARPAIKPIMQQARGNAAKQKKSGLLAKSIKVRAIPRSRVRIGIRVTTDSKSFGDKYYAAFQEFGWKAGKSNTKVAGTHFMEEAANAKQDSVLKDYSNRLNQLIRGAFR